MSKKKNDNNLDFNEFSSFMENPENAKFMIMSLAQQLEITPLEYSMFCSNKGKLNCADYDKFEKILHDTGAIDDDDYEDFLFPGFALNRTHIEDATPIPDAEKKTLRLKIQLRDITKPPLWREVEIPANYTFEKLHFVIQKVMNWDNAHLWQFQHSPYDSQLEIGPVSDDENELSLENASHDASVTPVTGFLKQKDDKLVYVYDFGDDWIHDIKVLSVEDKIIEHPKLLKWKGDHPIEDCGGIYDYLNLRNIYSGALKLSKKEEKEFLQNSFFNSMSDFIKYMSSQVVDPDEINDLLTEDDIY